MCKEFFLEKKTPEKTEEIDFRWELKVMYPIGCFIP